MVEKKKNWERKMKGQKNNIKEKENLGRESQNI